MDSQVSRARYEVEIGKKGEHLFKHLFPYARYDFMSAHADDNIRMSVNIPENMTSSFEGDLRRKFPGCICTPL